MSQSRPATSTMAGPQIGDWLVIGGLHQHNGSAPSAGHDPWMLVPLPGLRPGGPNAGWQDNTVLLRWGDLGPLEVRALSRDGSLRRVGRTTGEQLFDRLLPGPTLCRLAEAAPGPATASPLVPLFVLRTRPAPDGRVELDTYSQIRFLAEDALFIRTTPEPVVVTAVTDLEWVDTALRRHADDFLLLGNHQCYYRRCFPGRELEYKYNLTPPPGGSGADIWRLTALLYQRILDGGLPGYLPEYRDEFQAWDYVNHLYEVTGPPAEQGYVSFIPTTDGRHLVKRKWFGEDQLDRGESHTYGVSAPAGYEAYLRDELGIEPGDRAVALPPFRRVRYDVNFESVHTGHVYGVFFDLVSVLGAPAHRLSQCELEYLRSRTVLPPDPDAALSELAELATWLEGFLHEQGYDPPRGYYSKLSFLRDAVAAEPALTGAVS